MVAAWVMSDAERKRRVAGVKPKREEETEDSNELVLPPGNRQGLIRKFSNDDLYPCTKQV